MSIQFRTEEQQSRWGKLFKNFMLMLAYVTPVFGFIIVLSIGLSIIKKVSGIGTALKLLIFTFISLIWVPLIFIIIPMLRQEAFQLESFDKAFMALDVIKILLYLTPVFFVLYLNKVEAAAKREGIDLEMWRKKN